MMNRATESTLATIASALLRLCLGGIFLMHGWQKFQDGLQHTADWLQSLDIAFPTLAAPVLIGAELLGGALLLLGLATRFAALALLADMLVAIWAVHLQAGFMAQAGGYEYPLLLCVALLGFTLTGAGRTGLDRVISRRR